MHCRTYVIEAEFKFDDWNKVAAWAINGWRDYTPHPDRITHGIFPFQYSDCMAFSNEATAKEALEHFNSLKQDRKLRIVLEELVLNKKVL